MTSIPLAAKAMPRLGLGTWQLSGETCTSIVTEALKLGYRHVDTAAMYGNEKEVGAGIRASGLPRRELFITTKVWPDNLGAGDLQASAEASLKRLDLAAVDLLLIHWPNGNIPLAESIGALCATQRAGLTKAIGVSNFPGALMDEAVSLASEPLVCNQVEFHPFLSQDTVYAACRRHGMILTAYAPVARGRVNEETTITGIAKRLNASAGQVSLAWLFSKAGVAAIPKTASPNRLAENLAALDLTLTDADCRAIDGLGSASGRMVNTTFAPAWDPV